MQEFFTQLVQRVAPKHHLQASNEVIVTRRFFENFSGDSVHPRIQARPRVGTRVLAISFFALILGPHTAETYM